MNDRPTPLELIRIAHLTLANEVLPGASAAQQYPLRMIANALGIAARELAAHEQASSDESNRLNILYGNAPSGASLPARNRQFCKDIRSGKFEVSADEAARLRQHLLATAHTKLAAAHPKGLPTTEKIVV